MKMISKIQYLTLGLVLNSCLVVAQNMQISGGFEHTITLCETGLVMHTGSRTNNQNATGVWSGVNTTLTNVPAVGGSGNLSNIQMVDAGSTHHTIALTSTGSVIAFGNDYACQLGQGSAVYPPNPVNVLGVGGVGTLTGIKYIAGSSESSYAIRTSDGALIAWGSNTIGQLGLGFTNATQCTPVMVNSPLNANVVMVDGGDNFALALKSDGTVYSMGENANGQLGIGNTIDQSSPQQVLIGPGVPLTNVISISCGDGTSYAIRSDNTLWTWGHNGWGQGGLGNCTNIILYATQVLTGAQGHASGFLQNVKQVVGGNAHAVVLLNDGTVYTMGSDQRGQLGDGSIGGADACGLGIGCRFVPYYVSSLSNIRGVSEGDHWSFAVTNSGAVYSWGQNSNGQLGIGSTTGTGTPTAMNMGSCVILPVELTSFNVTLNPDNSSYLTWVTASEVNSQTFEIERSYDGVNFEVIGRVAASGHSSAAKYYEFIDHESDIISYGQVYYRLKMIDSDQSYARSKIEVVSLAGASDEIMIYPNPAGSGEQVHLVFYQKEASTASIELIDMLGHTIIAREVSVEQGRNDLSIQLPVGISKGIYSLKAVFNQNVREQKLVIR